MNPHPDPSTLKEAPWEVASDISTYRDDNCLYLNGQWYRCPALTTEQVQAVIERVRTNLNICDNTCHGLTRIKHIITRNVGHMKEGE